MTRFFRGCPFLNFQGRADGQVFIRKSACPENDSSGTSCAVRHDCSQMISDPLVLAMLEF